MSLLKSLRAPLAAALLADRCHSPPPPRRRPGAGAGGLGTCRRRRTGGRTGTCCRARRPPWPRRRWPTPTAWRRCGREGDFVAKRHADHHDHHEHGLLVHHLHQAVRAAEDAQGSANAIGRGLLEVRQHEAGHRHARRRQRLPLHRRAGRQGRRAPRGHAGREHRPPHLDQHERGACGGQHQQPPAGRPGLPGHGGLHRPVRGPVRHGLGHLPRAHGHRHRRPGQHRQGGRPGGRGADHDRLRPGRRRARSDGLQLADPPQQDRDGAHARPSAATCTTSCSPAKGKPPWHA